MGKFSIKQVYNDLQVKEESVSWNKLVWYSQNIPKHAFILWLAIQNKLVTQDKLKKWGTYDMMICNLCYEDMDSHQHLFFDCKYAKQFWSKVCLKIGLQWGEMEWNNTVNFFAAMENGNTGILLIASLEDLVLQQVFIWYGERGTADCLRRKKEVWKNFLRCSVTLLGLDLQA